MSRREMKEELTCPICMELFRQPRRLPCGHSYCHVCIKSMVERRAAESGYSRPLVCPECRDEVNIDFVRGVEGIPLDFKLSKLVDLFQFMKTNGDSDSSDDQPPYKSVPCPVTSPQLLPDTDNSTGTVGGAASLPAVHTPTTPVEQPTYLPLGQDNQISPADSGSNHPSPLHTAESGSNQSSQPRTGESALDSHSQSYSTEPDRDQHSHPHTTDLASGQSQGVSSVGTPEPSRSGSYSTGSLSGSSTLQASSVSLHSVNHPQSSAESPAANIVTSGAAASGVTSSQHQIAQTSTPPANVPSHTQHVDAGITFNSVLQSNRSEENLRHLNTLCASKTPDRSGDHPRDSLASVNVPSDQRLSEGNSLRQSEHTDPNSESHPGAVGGEVPTTRHGSKSSVSIQDFQGTSSSRTSQTIRNSEERNVGGAASRVSSERGDVDDVVSLPNWVGSASSATKRNQNLSLSSVSLPTQVNFDRNSSHRSSLEVRRSEDPERFSRAQSVPVETEEGDKKAAERSTSAKAASGKQSTQKTRRKVRSRFVDSDSSSDSDSSESDRPRVKRSTGKQKRWLMTRFLRAVIFSDSSSTDYSDNDNDEDIEVGDSGSSRTAGLNNSGRSSVNQRQVSSQRQSADSRQSSGKRQASGPSSQRTQSPHCPPEQISQGHSSSPAQSSRGSSQNQRQGTEETRLDQSVEEISGRLEHSASANQFTASQDKPQEAGIQPAQGCHPSIDSNTVPKELARHRDTGGSSFDHTTTPKTIQKPPGTKTSREKLERSRSSQHNSAASARQSVPSTSIETQVKTKHNPGGCEGHSEGRARGDQTAERLSTVEGAVGPLPTLYDNLNTGPHLPTSIADRTRYDNVGDTSAVGGQSHRVRSDEWVRNPAYSPCHQPDSIAGDSRVGQGRTLYDNIDDSELVFERNVPTPFRGNRRLHGQMQNPVTEIENLKTGFEHAGPEHINIGANRARSSSFDVESSQSFDNVEHMGELDHNSRVQLSSENSGHNPTSSDLVYNVGGDLRLRSHSDDNPSSYDNIISPISSSGSQDSDRFQLNKGISNHRQDMSQDSDHIAVGPHPQEGDVIRFCETVSDLDIDSPTGENFPVRGIRSDGEVEFVDNYFNLSLEQFKGGSASMQNLAPAAVAIQSDGSEQEGGREEGTVDSVTAAATSAPPPPPSSTSQATTSSGETGTEGSSGSTTGTDPKNNNNTKAASSSSGQDDNVEDADDNEFDEDDDDDGSHSGTSMLQSKKKPKSRLKKFLTSLLSLSSSSDEDEENYDNRTSSSKSSDW